MKSRSSKPFIMDSIDASLMENENGLVEDAEYDNGYEGIILKTKLSTILVLVVFEVLTQS